MTMDVHHDVHHDDAGRDDAGFGAGRDCVIFGAGEYYDALPDQRPIVPRDALVIAADGGLDHMAGFALAPDAVIGDFDSVRADPDAATRHDDVTRLPAEKDETDMMSAVKIGWARGARRFHIYGGLGGRLDHTLANLQMLAQISRHCGIGFLYGDGIVVTALTDGTLAFPAWEPAPRRMISVFAHSDVARHVTIAGLKYEVDDVTLRNTRALGVSNEFLAGREGSVAVGDGTLVVTYPAEAPAPRWWTSRGTEGPDALGEIDTHVSRLLAR